MRSRRTIKLKQNQFWRAQALFVVVFCLVLFAPSAHAEPWATHASRLPTLSKKLEDSENEIKALLGEKNHAEDPAAIHEIMRSLAKKHKDLADASAEYETERLHIRFKHPDRAAVVDRQYVHYKLKSLDEMAKEIGLDGRLDRLKAKVLSVFQPPAVTAKAAKEGDDRKPASLEEDDAPEKIRLTK